MAFVFAVIALHCCFCLKHAEDYEWDVSCGYGKGMLTWTNETLLDDVNRLNDTLILALAGAPWDGYFKRFRMRGYWQQLHQLGVPGVVVGVICYSGFEDHPLPLVVVAGGGLNRNNAWNGDDDIWEKTIASYDLRAFYNGESVSYRTMLNWRQRWPTTHADCEAGVNQIFTDARVRGCV
jgi:hypothetical protein